jgi:nitronate monooxygenase
MAADDSATVYGRVFDVAQQAAWPAEYGGRALHNRFFEAWSEPEHELASDRATLDDYAGAQRRGDFGTAAIYAGRRVALLRSECPAAGVVAAFTGDR